VGIVLAMIQVAKAQILACNLLLLIVLQYMRFSKFKNLEGTTQGFSLLEWSNI
jgi:hypothetical protein